MKTLTHGLLALVAVFLTAGAASAQSAMIGEGARVYAQNCSRCHNLRSPTERNNRDWSTIVLHMRARGNLTKSEANAVRAFLQATNGIGDGPPASPPAQPQAEKEEKREGNPEAVLTGDPGGEDVADPLLANLRRYLAEQAVMPGSVR